METSVLVHGARTPVGKLLGALADLRAPELGAIAIRAALERAHVEGEQLDAVLLGNVVQAGVGANPARQAAAVAGIPLSIPATAINKLCLSGLTAIGQADMGIRAGQWRTVLAGGMESMTNAPFLLPGARRGYKYGSTTLLDALDQDALICSLESEVMGAATERYQRPLGITREEQDEFSAGSHAKATAAIEQGHAGEEIVPVTVRSRRGDVVVDTDEGVRPGTTVEVLSGLKPAFGGTITAGSASQLSDGGAAVVVMARSEAEALGLDWIAEIVAYGTTAGPDPSLLLQPAGAITDALGRADGIGIDDLDVVEINEAFAGVPIASARQLGLDLANVNPNGGAIAIGHPVGMSGTRLALSLALELRRRGGGIGAAALCGGGGQGDAVILRVP